MQAMTQEAGSRSRRAEERDEEAEHRLLKVWMNWFESKDVKPVEDRL